MQDSDSVKAELDLICSAGPFSASATFPQGDWGYGNQKQKPPGWTPDGFAKFVKMMS